MNRQRPPRSGRRVPRRKLNADVVLFSSLLFLDGDHQRGVINDRGEYADRGVAVVAYADQAWRQRPGGGGRSCRRLEQCYRPGLHVDAFGHAGQGRNGDRLAVLEVRVDRGGGPGEAGRVGRLRRHPQLVGLAGLGFHEFKVELRGRRLRGQRELERVRHVVREADHPFGGRFVVGENAEVRTRGVDGDLVLGLTTQVQLELRSCRVVRVDRDRLREATAHLGAVQREREGSHPARLDFAGITPGHGAPAARFYAGDLERSRARVAHGERMAERISGPHEAEVVAGQLDRDLRTGRSRRRCRSHGNRRSRSGNHRRSHGNRRSGSGNHRRCRGRSRDGCRRGRTNRGDRGFERVQSRANAVEPRGDFRELLDDHGLGTGVVAFTASQAHEESGGQHRHKGRGINGTNNALNAALFHRSHS